jgi:hypothetical protein
VPDTETYGLQRRADGAVVVQIPSARDKQPRLPDAKFAFREGDPQFVFWDEKLRQIEANRG